MTIDTTRAQAIKGWMRTNELDWLATRAADARMIVEVGCWQGRSTRALADHSAGIVYAIDPWAGDYFNEDNSLHKIRTNVYDLFAANLADHIASGKVVPIKEAGAAAMRRLPSGRFRVHRRRSSARHRAG
jgi:hypothetical protein